MPCDKCKETVEKYRELREAVANVIGDARPHYDRRRMVSYEAMSRLVEALERVDGGSDEPVSDGEG